MGIFKIAFSYSLPNIIFTILQHSGKISDSAIVCGFSFFCHHFVNGIAFFLSLVGNSSDFDSLISLACLISYKPFKYSVDLRHKYEYFV
jgi:hypothetical protein